VQNYFKKNFTFQKIQFKHFSALDCFLIMTNDEYCHYSDLPSPMAYMNIVESVETKTTLSEVEIDRIIEMAWEDRTTFDAIKIQFGLSEAEIKKLMKKELKFSSYKLWRERVENCKTKHAKTRNPEIDRFKCNLQRTITHNKISKR
jgi:uncharacterized protein (TIGR03643 family)